MRELIFFMLGSFFGGIVIAVVMCCLQINRTNDYESEIYRLMSRNYKENGEVFPLHARGTLLLVYSSINSILF